MFALSEALKKPALYKGDTISSIWTGISYLTKSALCTETFYGYKFNTEYSAYTFDSSTCTISGGSSASNYTTDSAGNIAGDYSTGLDPVVIGSILLTGVLFGEILCFFIRWKFAHDAHSGHLCNHFVDWEDSRTIREWFKLTSFEDNHQEQYDRTVMWVRFIDLFLNVWPSLVFNIIVFAFAGGWFYQPITSISVAFSLMKGSEIFWDALFKTRAAESLIDFAVLRGRPDKSNCVFGMILTFTALLTRIGWVWVVMYLDEYWQYSSLGSGTDEVITFWCLLSIFVLFLTLLALCYNISKAWSMFPAAKVVGFIATLLWNADTVWIVNKWADEYDLQSAFRVSEVNALLYTCTFFVFLETLGMDYSNRQDVSQDLDFPSILFWWVVIALLNMTCEFIVRHSHEHLLERKHKSSLEQAIEPDLVLGPSNYASEMSRSSAPAPSDNEDSKAAAAMEGILPLP
eukprot:TRINITY_DN28969_c0_g1_i1.p1 TRINITY_DN28969_c0_g1~~TRINITY_DN28969_c0_g1_i1.p1  ORF type:complete len:459 (-),score=93.63 TRINITY_DN28969_c0_g1_i1:96-1472(-)